LPKAFLQNDINEQMRTIDANIKLDSVISDIVGLSRP
jgi:hypothetical protein